MKLFRVFYKSNDNDERIPFLIQVALFFILFYASYITRSPIDIYYGYVFYLLLFPSFIARYGLVKEVTLPFFLLFLIGAYYSFTGVNVLSNFIKVWLGSFAAYLFMYFIVIKSEYSIKGLFKTYLKFSFFACLLGVLQTIAFNLGLDRGGGPFWLFGFLGYAPGAVFGLRITSFFGEPTYFAMFCSGALYVALHDIIYRSRSFFYRLPGAIIVILGLYLSFSGTVIGTLAIIFVLLGINYGIFRYALIATPFVVFLLAQIITSSRDYSDRYEGTLSLFTDAPQESFNVYQYHGSSVILYDHFRVAYLNFFDYPLFGSGIGSHPVAYEKYSLIRNQIIFKYEPNKADASSMFNRLMSETGLFGLGIFSILIFGAFFRRNKHNDNQYWIISSACLVVILINMARQGNYFLNGFPFYVWMYYAAWKAEKQHLNETNASLPNKSRNSQKESVVVS